MLIQKDQQIAGLPAVDVRSMLRILRDRPHSVLAIEEAFEVPDGEQVVRELKRLGYVETTDRSGPFVIADAEAPKPGGPYPELWSTTIAGSALAKARIGKPMSRVKATALLDGFIARVRSINDDPGMLHWIDEVVLYGSLAVPGDGPVGDVDVGVTLVPRFDPDEYFERQEAMIKSDGASTSTLVEALGYAEVKVFRMLKAKSSRIDVVPFDRANPLPPGAHAVVVYRRS